MSLPPSDDQPRDETPFSPPPPPPPPPALPDAAFAPLSGGPDARSTRRSLRPVLLGAVAALALAGGAFALTSNDAEEPATTTAATSTGTVNRATAKAEGPGQAMAPLPKARPKLSQPVAGEIGQDPTAGLQTAPADDGKDPKITGPASSSTRGEIQDPGVAGLKVDQATALPNGVALPPLEAPEAVLDVIRAGNIIARSPYKWGGGHGRFQDNGYDCSGSVSYALYYAGLIDGPHVSGDLMAYGKPGPGKWISIYASPGHVYMEVAGIRFDTSGQTVTGSRWQNELRGNGGFEVRHPEGL
jgi:cell wall-associated NlpC family hydrolase